MHKNIFQLLILIPVCLLSACSVSPSLPVFGASFPDWLFCLAGGVIATWCLHLFLVKKKKAWFAPHIIGYPLFTALVAMVAWLLIFSQ